MSYPTKRVRSDMELLGTPLASAHTRKLFPLRVTASQAETNVQPSHTSTTHSYQSAWSAVKLDQTQTNTASQRSLIIYSTKKQLQSDNHANVPNTSSTTTLSPFPSSTSTSSGVSGVSVMSDDMSAGSVRMDEESIDNLSHRKRAITPQVFRKLDQQSQFQQHQSENGDKTATSSYFHPFPNAPKAKTTTHPIQNTNGSLSSTSTRAPTNMISLDENEENMTGGLSSIMATPNVLPFSSPFRLETISKLSFAQAENHLPASNTSYKSPYATAAAAPPMSSKRLTLVDDDSSDDEMIPKNQTPQAKMVSLSVQKNNRSTLTGAHSRDGSAHSTTPKSHSQDKNKTPSAVQRSISRLSNSERSVRAASGQFRKL